MAAEAHVKNGLVCLRYSARVISLSTYPSSWCHMYWQELLIVLLRHHKTCNLFLTPNVSKRQGSSITAISQIRKKKSLRNSADRITPEIHPGWNRVLKSLLTDWPTLFPLDICMWFANIPRSADVTTACPPTNLQACWEALPLWRFRVTFSLNPSLCSQTEKHLSVLGSILQL